MYVFPSSFQTGFPFGVRMITDDTTKEGLTEEIKAVAVISDQDFILRILFHLFLFRVHLLDCHELNLNITIFSKVFCSIVTEEVK